MGGSGRNWGRRKMLSKYIVWKIFKIKFLNKTMGSGHGGKFCRPTIWEAKVGGLKV